MICRHIDELEHAVRVAGKAAGVGHADPDHLTRLLYQRWYLGLTSQQDEVPAPSGPGWRAWSPLWTAEMGAAGPELVRLHLRAVPSTALHVLALVTTRARTWGQPWQLTSTALGSAWATPETTVLSVPLASISPLRTEIEQLVQDLRPFLALGVPALTLRIGRGASLAQDPPDGHTFGEHRCRLVAEAVLDSLRFHHRERVVRTISAFAEAGVDPERPYLAQRTTWDRAWTAA